MVREEIEAVTIIKGNGNWWWAGSLQQGFLWLKLQNTSSSDLVLIINDDTEFEADFLENAINLMRGKDNTLLLSQCYSTQSGKFLGAGVHVNWRQLTFRTTDRPEEVNCLSTRGLFLSPSAFFMIGGFYPTLLPHYLSDYEFTIRAYRKGMKLLTDPSVRLRLDESTTGFHQFKSATFYQFLRNYFSIKSAANPLAWTVFITLACPWPWKILNWSRVCGRTLHHSVIAFIKRKSVA